jgi:hypothetical protein
LDCCGTQICQEVFLSKLDQIIAADCKMELSYFNSSSSSNDGYMVNKTNLHCAELLHLSFRDQFQPASSGHPACSIERQVSDIASSCLNFTMPVFAILLEIVLMMGPEFSRVLILMGLS